MKKVGFVTTPLHSAHAIRGVGFYTKRLLEHLPAAAAKSDVEIVEIKSENARSLEALDLIHYPFFDLFFNTLPIVKKTKTIVTVHDVTPLEFPNYYPPGVRGWIKLQSQRFALGKADMILTDSYASVKSIHKYLQVPHTKLRLVYLAADEKFKPITNKTTLKTVRQKYNLPDKFVLYVGDVNWNKNIPGLIKACKIAKQPLVIVGKQAVEVEKLDLSHRQLMHLKDVDWSTVLRVGFVPDQDLVAIYNLANVYCQPSFAEGFGLGVLEAMACGTAVACSQTHSLPEIAGFAATYFDPHHPAKIAQALKAGKTGQELAQARKFSWTKTATETVLAYQEAMCR